MQVVMAAQVNKKPDTRDSWERAGKKLGRWLSMMDPLMGSANEVSHTRKSKYGCLDHIIISSANEK